VDTRKSDTRKAGTRKVDTRKVDTRQVDSHKGDSYQGDFRARDTHMNITDEARTNDEMLYGRNPVWELLQSGKPVNKLLFQSEGTGGRFQDMVSHAREHKIPFQFVDKQALDRLTEKANHQGVLGYVSPREYAEVEDILALAREKGEEPFVLVLDEVEDPHNLGALIRTADAAGVHGVIIPKRRSVSLTATVAKTSAGAVEHVLVARVGNLVQTLKELQKEGCWVSGAEAGGTEVYSSDLTGARVIVVGSEGKGLSRLVKETCDEIVSLPMQGQVNSLNASVAGSILLYEVLRQRRLKK
jgi:23S rRNA (guanosine2251-2'-O)-methyltransferase